MRFGIRDLLLATLLVSIYCVVFILAPNPSWTPLDVGLASVPFFAVMWVPFWWWRSHKRMGRIDAVVRARWFWPVHFYFAGLALVAAIVLAAIGQGFPKPVIGQLLGMHVMFLFFMGGLRFGENGLQVGPAFLSWDGYTFKLNRDKSVLRYKKLPSKRFASVFQSSLGKMPVPRDRLEEIDRLLTAMGSLEVQAQMNTDERG